MRIVSWNMNYWQARKTHARAWDYLRDELRADLALVQEAVPPESVAAVYRPINGDSPQLNWGSAVVLFNPTLQLRPRPRIPLAECYLVPAKGDALPDSHPGACAVADVLDADGRFLLTAISLYGQWEVMPHNDQVYACARVHRMLSDLTGLFVTSKRKPVLIAGDFNSTTQVGSYPVEAANARVIFDRLLAWQLTDCIAHTHSSRPRLEGCSCGGGERCAHVGTFRSRNRSDSAVTQLDYAFASQALVWQLKGCDVVQDEAAWNLSDHCPVILELAIE